MSILDYILSINYKSMINLLFIPVFNDWCKREIIDDKTQLQKYPSVIKYIIGHRGDKNQC